MELKVGDRIRAYGQSTCGKRQGHPTWGSAGVIRKVFDDWIFVEFDSLPGERFGFHRKQIEHELPDPA